MTWAWSLNKGGISEGGIQLISPHFSSCGWAEKRICVNCARLIICRVLGRNTRLTSKRTRVPVLNCLGVVEPRAWHINIFYFLVLAVGNFAQKDGVVAIGVKLLLSCNVQRLVLAWTWNFNRGLRVLSFISWLKNRSLSLTGSEVCVARNDLLGVRVWII